MAQTIFYIIVIILIIDFIFERFLDYLNGTRLSPQLPDGVKGIYDADRYEKMIKYKRENGRFAFLTSSFSFLLILLMLFFEGFAYVDEIARQFVDHPILVALIFFGILMLASDILGTPFAWYDTFVIEEKYGFNKTTPKTFVTDKLKSWLLAIIIGGGILALIIWFYLLTREYFWLIAWAAVSLFSIFMTMFYSNLIVPLFNKQTPLEEGELRNKIQEFSKKAGFELENIYVIDGSKRSTKANAYFTGLGSKKRIVLFDTLIEDLEPDEIVAVLAHEIGHYKHNHMRQNIIISVLESGLMFYVLSLFIGNEALSEALGASEPAFHLAIITFGILYSPFTTILGLGLNVLSRKNEYQADAFAAKYGLGKDLASGLKKLSVKNLSNLTPHPTYVFVYYSHPPLLKRLEAIEQKQNDEA